jgi:hypothetical protein
MAKPLVVLILALVSLSGRAHSLKVGDLLLQPLDCWTCSLIEAEERTIYSHMGVVVATTPEVLVAEAKGTVRKLPLERFQAATEKGQRIAVLRYHHPGLVQELEQRATEFLGFFDAHFEGAAYDDKFLWHNVGADGRELLYCSELVAKLIQRFLGLEPIVKRMHFNQNRELWARFFSGSIPDGEWGNSPADYERSHLFVKVGEL